MYVRSSLNLIKTFDKEDFSQFWKVNGLPFLHVRSTTDVKKETAKTTPILTRSHSFPRVSRELHVITSTFDWVTVLSRPFRNW